LSAQKIEGYGSATPDYSDFKTRHTRKESTLIYTATADGEQAE